MEMDYCESQEGIFSQESHGDCTSLTVMNYRYDGRSEDQFKCDIKSRTQEERRLFLLWLDLIERNSGKRPQYTDTGCGQSGELLTDKEVSMDPDFNVEGYGKIEVKFSKPLLDKFFHLKASQIKSYIRDEAIILMINGADEAIPQYTMLKTDALKDIAETCKVIPWTGFGSKMSYKIPVSKFVWRPLK